MKLIFVFVVILVASVVTSEDVPSRSMTDPKADRPASSSEAADIDAPLGPILAVPDEHGHLNPVIEDKRANADHPLIGRPDGHDVHDSERPLLGRPDGHDVHDSERPLLGRPDGHDDRRDSEDDDETKDYEYNLEEYSETTDPDDDIMPDELLRTENEEYYDEGRDQSSEGQTDDDDDDNDEDDQPLIRCKRPMCMMYCKNGFQTDETGCETCHCLDDPCRSAKCETGLLCRARPCERVCKTLTAECYAAVPNPSQCAMPMCADECIHGYRTDDHGCMTCDCVVPNVDTRGTPSPPENVDAPRACPMMKCVPCATGYVTDERGCRTCQCLPCAEPMCTTDCLSNGLGYKLDDRGCMTCDCNEPALPPLAQLELKKFPCATPMCATYCPLGYRNNAAGCMTCDCKQELCGEKECDFGQICQNRTVNYKTGPTCIPKPLCYKSRDMAGVGQATPAFISGQYAPECESDGSFKPLQCNTLAADCWCVDDRGQEMNGSRTAVFVENHKPNCARNYTVMLEIYLDLEALNDNVDHFPAPFVDRIKRELPDVISDCIMMNKQYISVHSAKDELLSDEIQLFHVDLIVRNDGRTDLPSAAEYMTRRLYRNTCPVVVDGKTLTARMDSLKIKYKPSLLPAGIWEDPRSDSVDSQNDEGVRECHGWIARCFSYRYKYLMLIGGVLAILILLTVIFIVTVKIVRLRRARSGVLHFRHQPLESQISTSSEKSLLTTGVEADNVQLVSNEAISEKAALA